LLLNVELSSVFVAEGVTLYVSTSNSPDGLYENLKLEN